MNTRLLLLPALCLGGAALLFAPMKSSQAFTKLKLDDFLDEDQRDVRVFDNFQDATANDNVTPASQFPGQTGVELALWKSFAEWGSKLHGDGTGDPLTNPLGSGGANFDAFWAGAAGGVGQPNHNIISAITSCSGGGTLAYTEVPVFDGWRIRFCDEWTWDDGPGTIGSRWDIQGVGAHEYGHALGLGHSSVSGATMWPSVGAGQTGIRSISADDIAGVQCIYGVAAGIKPTITATVASAGTLTIYGTNFGATGNEVWFKSSTTTPTNVDPIVRVTGVSSSWGGTAVSLTIPGNAGPGDVIVRRPGTGGAVISNAFPTDLVGTFGSPPAPAPDISSVTPAAIEALIPGTAQTITLAGTHFDLATSVLLDGSPIDPSRYTIVNATTITLDMPQTSSLGDHDLGVSNGVITDDFPVTIVAPATAKLEWGTGDALNVIDRDNGLDLIVAGEVGALHVVRGSPDGPPILNRFQILPTHALVTAGAYVIPPQGWLAVHLGNLPDPALVGSTWFAKSFVVLSPMPFQGSNDQSITLVP